MPVTMTKPPDNSPESSSGSLEIARREKLRKSSPWGSTPGDHDSKTIRRLGTSACKKPKLKRRRLLPKGQHAEQHGPHVRTAGRIVLMRDTGKLIFADIRDWTGRIQLYIGKKQVGEQNWALAQCFDLGDLIGVEGELKRTKTGELTIFVDKLYFLTKSLETPPGQVSWPERSRITSAPALPRPDSWRRCAAEIFEAHQNVQSIRQTLAAEGFVEVEGPTLHSIAGGAAARPFVTHHNTLDIDLYMRIALELHLKRLLVGGMERVYELGRVYRNEGISPRHNPEFTMLELYQAYGDYRSMMDLTEKLIVNAIETIHAGASRNSNFPMARQPSTSHRRSLAKLTTTYFKSTPALQATTRLASRRWPKALVSKPPASIPT